MSLEVLRSNSKEHSSFIKSGDKKKQYGLSNLSKFSSHKDLRDNSQISQGSGIYLYSKLPSAKDYKENSVHSSMGVGKSALNVQGDDKGGMVGCFCEKGRCRIF